MFGRIVQGARWLDRMLKINSELNLGLVAAGVAFFGLLAFFPALVAIVTFWGIFADPAMLESQVGAFSEIVPDAATRVVGTRLHNLAARPSPLLGFASFASFLLSLWVSRLAVAGLLRAMNTVYCTNARGRLHHQSLSLGLTFLLMGVAIVAIAAVIFIPLAGQVFLAMPPPGPGVDLFRWCVALVSVWFGLAVVYRYGPNRTAPRTPWISPGGIAALVAWSLASWAFTTFLTYYDRYDVVYGSLGTSVAILLWFQITAYAVVLGGLINADAEGVEFPET